MLVNITGGSDLTLFEVDEAAERVTRVSSDVILAAADSHTI